MLLVGSMPKQAQSSDQSATNVMTELILRIFKANGRLLLAGDQLVAPLGLTSARWQVLGSVAASDAAKPVASLARDMGVSRQAVQRIVNDLARGGLLMFEPNPRHKKAQLVVFTAHGRDLFEEALQLQRPWVTSLAAGLSAEQVQSACDTLEMISGRLDAEAPTTDESVSFE